MTKNILVRTATGKSQPYQLSDTSSLIEANIPDTPSFDISLALSTTSPVTAVAVMVKALVNSSVHASQCRAEEYSILSQRDIQIHRINEAFECACEMIKADFSNQHRQLKLQLDQHKKFVDCLRNTMNSINDQRKTISESMRQISSAIVSGELSQFHTSQLLKALKQLKMLDADIKRINSYCKTTASIAKN
jgi:hypothetical protein